MSYCFRRLISPIAAMVAILAMGMAIPARADLVVEYSEDAGPVTTVTLALGNPGLFPGLTGVTSFSTTDFTVNLQSGQAFINSPDTELLGSTVSITNSGTNGTQTLHLILYATGYSSPTTPPSVTLASQLGGSVAVGDPFNVLAYHSYVDQSNTGTPGGLLTPGLQTADITQTNSSYSTGSASTSIAALASPFAMVQTIDFTMSQGSRLNYSSSTTLTSVPEPSTMAIAGLGALGMIGYGIRRRKSA